MNCHSALRLISSERDGALTSTERAALESHLASCSDCREARRSLADVMEVWRTHAAATPPPDVERAWQDIRREIRASRAPAPSGSRKILRWSVPLGAAAALAAAIAVAPHFASNPHAEVAQLERAHAEYVDVPGDASSMVYVDDQSGWLVVWAVNNDARPSGG